MKTRLTALVLAALMLLGLAACAPKEPAAPSEEPTASQDAAAPETTPDATAPSAGADASTEPSESAEPSQRPSDTPSPTPSAIGDPTAPPAEKPAKDPTAAEVYAAVSAAAGVSYDNSTAYIDAFYTSLDLDTLSDYVFYMPPMSTQIEEIFIAKVNSGMDAVKSACRDRQAAMAEDAAFYATTGAYVDSYQLVTEGDWVLFCVCEKASDAVSAFRSSVK